MPVPHTTNAAAINGELRRVQVLLPLPLPGVFDYRVPPEIEIQPGAFVSVPFGSRDAMLVDGELAFDVGFEGAGGGYATTASDLARWAKALYAGDVLRGVRDEAVRGEPCPLGANVRYGLGVIVDATPLGPAWGHRGFFPGSLSEMRYYPELGIAVAVLVNSSADPRLPKALPEWATEFARIAAGR